MPESTPDLALTHATRLYRGGWIPLPTCAPLGGTGVCSAKWHPKPCGQIGKRALVRGFTAWTLNPPPLHYCLGIIRRAWPCNLAVVVALGHVVVEADSAEAEEEIRALAGQALDDTPLRRPRPGRGPAWLFRLPQTTPELRNRAALGASGAIDVRAPSRGILVVPPSVHVTGHIYQWAADRAPWELQAVVIPPALLALIAKTNVPRGGMKVVVPTPRSGELPRRVAALIACRPDVRTIWEGRGKQSGDTSRSGYDYAFARVLLRDGVHVGEVAAALAVRPDSHSRDPEYVKSTVQAALASLGGTR